MAAGKPRLLDRLIESGGCDAQFVHGSQLAEGGNLSRVSAKRLHWQEDGTCPSRSFGDKRLGSVRLKRGLAVTANRRTLPS
jgi:hypothetical protein